MKEYSLIEMCIFIFWPDNCDIDCRGDGNLLATCGMGKSIEIFDRRKGKLVNTFANIHKGECH